MAHAYRRSGTVVLAVSLAFAACSDPAASVGATLDTGAEPVSDVNVGVDVAKAPDVGEVTGADVPADPDGLGDTDTSETPVDCLVTPDGPGCPCDNSNACDSGWCVLTRNGEQCADYCGEACPTGFECRAVSSPGAGADVSNICVDRNVYLCKPCDDSEDCAALGFEGADKCVDYGAAGKFCGISCDTDGQCPDGYECGAEKQCVISTGECPCAPIHIGLEASTTCSSTNQYGTCSGQRRCGPDGLTACDADVPAAELCDGKDNDCNGGTDDIPVTSCPIVNVYGTCQGTQLCTGGVPNCQGQEPATDTCDGQDNDCDGTVDEGYPNNDSDELGDCVDPDDDNDGILDESDNCEITPNTDQLDTNGDGEGDECDPDDDGDNSPDVVDCEDKIDIVYPFAPEECDGVDNDCDSATDEKSCADTNPCTDDVCDPTTGCDHPFNNLQCSDGNPCTTGDLCAFGTCSGNFVACDDLNSCTTDACVPGQGCVNAPHALACSDGNACTEGDVCSASVCISGPLVDCSDDNACTITTCNAQVGCQVTPIANPCNDGNPCTISDKCVGTGCSGSDISCDDGLPCTIDNCDPGSGCVHVPSSGGNCNDGIVCTTGDSCVAGVCQGNDSGCTCFTIADCVASEDGNACNGSLYCDTGTNPFKCKIEQTSVVSCTLPAGLSKDCATVSCDPLTGDCSTHLIEDGTACDDTDGCSESDVCLAGVCGGSKKICNDTNPCTVDVCDITNGCVFTPVPGVKSCQDGNACTANDACENGFCFGKTPVVCNDSNPCTDDTCQPSTGCVYAANQHPCSDFSSCTTGDQCGNSKCNPGSGVTCDDGDKCNGLETCNATDGCLDGPPLVCNDGLPCTEDSCGAAQGCIYVPSDLVCSDGAFCNGAEKCIPGQGCTGTNLPDNTLCSDGNGCTKDDKCIAGSCIGIGLQCDDSNSCTVDSCDTAGTGCKFTKLAQFSKCDDGDKCTVTDVCDEGFCSGSGALDCNDGDICTDEVCLKATGCKYTNNQATCSDSDSCTTGDKCQAGTCAGTPLNCSNVGDDDPCTTDDQCVGGACVGTPIDCSDLADQCNDGLCQGGFCYAAPLTKACSDGDPCTTNDVCSAAGTCSGNPLNCSAFDSACAKGVCQDGACLEQSLACQAVGFVAGFSSGSLFMTPVSGGVATRGALGQGNSVGAMKNPTGLQVRLGFPGGL